MVLNHGAWGALAAGQWDQARYCAQRVMDVEDDPSAAVVLWALDLRDGRGNRAARRLRPTASLPRKRTLRAQAMAAAAVGRPDVCEAALAEPDGAEPRAGQPGAPGPGSREGATMSFELALLLLPGLVIGITFHEFAHAWSASLLGDDFPRRQGRVSLNPLRHLSGLGTLVLFLLGFGWGKPVIVNLYNFRHPKRDYLLTSLAGPLANVVVLGLCIGGMYLMRRPSGTAATRAAMGLAYHGLKLTGLINAILAVVNLIPIPPLDGSKIWPCLIPGMKLSFGRKATSIFIALLIFLSRAGWLSPIFDTVLGGIDRIMPALQDAGSRQRTFADGMRTLGARQYDLAEQKFTAILEDDPKDYPAYYQRTHARHGLRNFPGAMDDMDKAIEGFPCPAYYNFRAELLDQARPGHRSRRRPQPGQHAAGRRAKIRRTVHPAEEPASGFRAGGITCP